MTNSLLTAAEAIELLKVKPQTLYSYVSRGLIRSVRHPDGRSRLYFGEDVARLHERAAARSGHGPVAADAMHHGEPIIPTRLVEITKAGPRYRGHLATKLAMEKVTFEAVSELLWTGLLHEGAFAWDTCPLPQNVKELPSPDAPEQMLETIARLTIELGMARGTASARVRKGDTLHAARELIQATACSLPLLSRSAQRTELLPEESISDCIARAFVPADRDLVSGMIEALLVLFADHELSPGTFAARIAASSGAPLHSCVTAALCTMTGSEIGRHYARMEQVFLGSGDASQIIERARAAIRSGSSPLGFGHPLYPAGDPRAAHLFQLMHQGRPATRDGENILLYAETIAREFEIHPRHELAILALTAGLGFPRGSSAGLFVLARLPGLVAHILEQRLDGRILRPRAKFLGLSSLG